MTTEGEKSFVVNDLMWTVWVAFTQKSVPTA
jgi:hypothetical protein